MLAEHLTRNHSIARAFFIGDAEDANVDAAAAAAADDEVQALLAENKEAVESAPKRRRNDDDVDFPLAP